jgi:hypothetical protein
MCTRESGGRVGHPCGWGDEAVIVRRLAAEEGG